LDQQKQPLSTQDMEQIREFLNSQPLQKLSNNTNNPENNLSLLIQFM